MQGDDLRRGSSDYLDFELEIGEGSGRLYPVAVLRSPAGEARGTMHFPFDELALENYLVKLDNALLRSGGQRRRIPSEEEQAVQAFGQALFDALLSGAIRDCYNQSRQEAARQRKGLRLKLRIHPPKMSVLPWEFLYDSRRDEYVCLSLQTPIVRYLEAPHPVQPLTVTPPMRILGMVASPVDQPSLGIDLEKQRVEQAIQDLKSRGLVELEWLQGETRDDLHEAMWRGPWHIFHFVGHGGFDVGTDEGFLALTDSKGRTSRLRATGLSLLLADQADLRLVLLNSCEGARGGEQDVFSSTAATLVRRGIPAVVAMQREITDGAAIAFVRAFYRALAHGMPVDRAVVEARKAISLAVNNTVEWGTPLLYMRAPDGVLFQMTGVRSREQVTTELPPHQVDAESMPTKSELSASMKKDEEQPNTIYSRLSGRVRKLPSRIWVGFALLAVLILMVLSLPGVMPPMKTPGPELVTTVFGTLFAGSPATLTATDDVASVTTASPLTPNSDHSGTSTAISGATETPRITPRSTPSAKALTPTASSTHSPQAPDVGVTATSASTVTAEGFVELTCLGRGLINQSVVSPNGQTLAVAGSQGLSLYVLEKSESLSLVEGLAVVSLAWSADGARLVSGDSEGIMRVWDGSSGEELLALEGHNRSISFVMWSPDGTRLLSLGSDGTARVWNVSAAAGQFMLKGHENSVMNAAWSPDGRLLATHGWDRTIRIWNANNGEELFVFTDPSTGVGTIAWSPDGTRVASSGNDFAVKVWDAVNGEELYVLEGHAANVLSVSWSSDGTRLASSDGRGVVRVWDVDKAEGLLVLEGHTAYVRSVAWSQDGKRLASGGGDNSVRVWDVTSGDELHVLWGHSSYVTSVAWLPDSVRLISESADETIRLWDATHGEELFVLEGYTRAVESVAWSPDGARMASGNSAGITNVWDTANWQLLLSLKEYGHVASATWSPDGKRLASAQSEQIFLWDANLGWNLRDLPGHEDGVTSVAWSPDGSRLASAGRDAMVRIWDAAPGGRELLALGGYESDVMSVAWSPDGTQLVTGDDEGKVRVWDVNSEEEIWSAGGHKFGVSSVGWSPDGARLVSGGDDQQMRVWDALNGDELLATPYLEGNVVSVAWSPNGKWVVSGGSDGIIRVWDAISGKELFLLEGHTLTVNSVAWSPDGTKIVSGSADGTVRIWGRR